MATERSTSEELGVEGDETWRRLRDGALAQVRPLGTNGPRQVGKDYRRYVKVRIHGKKTWITYHLDVLAELFEPVDDE